MANKYSGSLDVGEELDEENKRPPVIDDDDGEETPSAEDDFNDLIRRELGDITPQPKKKEAPKEEVKIEPAKEVPKVDAIKIEKPAPKPVRPAKETPKVVEPKIVKAEVKAPVKKEAPKTEPKKEAPKIVAKPVVKPAKKEVPKVVKPEPKPVKKEAPKVVKAELRKAEKSEPKKESGSRWMTLLILLLIAIAAVYAVHALRNGKDDAALGCAMNYASQKNGVSLAWKDANSVEQYWLKTAYESASELEAARIFHMLACPEAFLSTLSDPAGYLNCKTPTTYVLIDQQTIDENPIAALDENSVLTKLNMGKASKNFVLKYQLTTPAVSAWEVQLNTTNSTKK